MSNRLFALLGFCLLASCSQRLDEDPQAPLKAINPLNTQPFAQAWVNQKPLKLTLDTGSVQPTILFEHVLLGLGATLRGSGPIQNSNIYLSTTPNTNPLPQPASSISAPIQDYQGIFGWPVISNSIWNINFPDNHHSFHSRLPGSVASLPSLAILPNRDILQINDNSGRSIILDTGAQHPIYLGKSAWRAWKRKHPTSPVSLYTGFSPAAGGFFSRECMQAQEFTVGPLRLTNIMICESFVVPALSGFRQDFDVIIGLDALKHCNLWIDGPGNRIYFQNSTSQADNSPTMFNQSGMVFVPRSNSYQVRVLKHSPAWKAGFRNGDSFVALNDGPFPSAAVMRYFLGFPGAESRWTVNRNGQTQTITLEIPAPDQPPVAPKPAPEPVPQSLAPAKPFVPSSSSFPEPSSPAISSHA